MADKSQLESILWEGANVLRSKMDANDYKDYLLGIIFYKYLSDSLLVVAYDLWRGEKTADLEAAQAAYEEAYEDEGFKSELKDNRGFILPPAHTYTRLAMDAKRNDLKREDLQAAFNEIQQSDKIFEGLFADVDLYSRKLGPDDRVQNRTLTDLIKAIDQAQLLGYESDVLGDAYEYMIRQFASETGKKAGEFYTPREVSQILTRIAIAGQEGKFGLTVYDAAMGSASLLLSAKHYAKEPGYIQYYGQELITSTFNLARMNMFLHNIAPENQHLRNADTLDADWPTEEETTFDMVLMNPPYSQRWSANPGFLTKDERFSGYGVLPPKSAADYAFLLHGFYHLKDTGTMAIILPHGVLFRGAAEGAIRQRLLENGSIYAVIGLPANLFYNTGIPTCVVILRKKRMDASDRSVLFIDASKEFVKEKRQNVLKPEHIDAIVQMFNAREDVKKHAHLAAFEEIASNEYNLNIPRYVDNSDPEPEIDLGATAGELSDIDQQIKAAEGELLTGLRQLTAKDVKLQEDLRRLIEQMEKGL